MYFDSHVHPSLKSYLTNGRVNCWGFIESGILSHDLSSECNFTQMKNADVRIVVAALHAIEQAFCAPHLLKGVLPYFSPLDGKLLKDIEDGKITYYQLLINELSLLEKYQTYKEDSFQFVNSFNDVRPDMLNVVLSIEGAHSFINTKSEDYDDICKDILANFRSFKKQRHRILFISLTHLSQGVLCTHAYGMKMQMIFRDQRFYPKDIGIQTWGREFIREALSNENGNRILIDVKHMSLHSRRQFYSMRKKEFPNVPIVASHMGVTGCSIFRLPVHSVQMQKGILHLQKEKQRIKVKYSPLRGVHDTFFNPCSINLYDEEIVEIVNSRGLMGISVDQRILGYGKREKEFFSLEEYNDFYKELFDSERVIETDQEVDINLEDDFDEQEEAFTAHLTNGDARHQFRYFCNTIVHIVKVGGDNAWDCICMGSDYDGIIDPVYCMPTIAGYKDLEKALLEFLPEFLNVSGIHQPDLKSAVRKIMYENGNEFLKNNFL